MAGAAQELDGSRDLPVVQVLGTVEFLTPAGATPVGGPVQRAVLAFLALHERRSVGVEQILLDIWGPDATTSERRSLATLLSRLRRTTEPFGWAIEHRAGAYRLTCEGPATDAQVFLDELDAAQDADPDDAVVLLERALRRWAGPPLVAITAPFADGWRQRLSGDRHRAMDLLARAYLDLGRHDDAVVILEELTRLTPYEESRWVLLVETLHRAGRAQDALAAFRRIDRQLRDELGIDPGPELRAAELAVLQRSASDGRRFTAAPHRSPFVGRFHEVVELRTAVDAALDGGPSTVVVRGEAGIGKTRLVDEVLLQLPDTVQVARGACLPEDSSPVVALLDPLVKVVGTGNLDALGPVGDDLRRLVAPGDPLDPDLLGLVRARLAASACAAVAHLCARNPLVVVVDDVHQADPVTLHLVRQLSDASSSRPLCLLLVERPSGTPAVWSECPTASVTLGPLQEADASAMVASLVSSLDRTAEAKDQLRVVVEAAGGVPLLLEQLTAEVRATPDAPRTSGLHGTVESRLRTLSAPSRAVIEVAAVDGLGFDLVAVAEAAEVSLADAARAVDSAGALSLIDRYAGDRTCFSHALIRDAVLTRIGPTTLAVHHAALARAHDRHGDAIHAAQHAARSHHLLDPAAAGRILLAGGTGAIDTGRFDDAVEWFGLATEMDGLDLAHRLEAEIGLGSAMVCSDEPEGRTLVERALRRAVDSRLWTCAADALQRGSRIGDPFDGQKVSDFSEVCQTVLDGLGTAEPVRSARILSLLFHAHVVQDPVRAQGYLSQLCGLDPSDPETAVIADVCRFRMDVVARPADHTLAARGAQMREDLQHAGRSTAAVLVATLELAAHLQAGTDAPAVARDTVADGAVRLGRPDVGLVLDLVDVACSIGRDPLEVADRTLVRVLDRAVAVGAAATVVFHSLALRREQGRASEVTPLLLALPGAASDPATRVVASMGPRELGEVEVADDHLDAAVQRIIDLGPVWTSSCGAALTTEETALAGRTPPPEFLDLAEELLLPSSGAMLLFAQVGMHLGPADRYLALVQLLRGGVDEFERLNRRAGRLADDAGLVNHRMWCQADRLLAGLDDVNRAALRRTAQRHGCVRLVRTLDGPA